MKKYVIKMWGMVLKWLGTTDIEDQLDKLWKLNYS